MMGGQIWVESELGRSSTFSFVVHLGKGSASTSPAAASPAARGQAGTEGSEGSEGSDGSEGSEIDDFSGCRILLAEDMEINREIVLALLEPTGVSIECVENGNLALRIFNASPNAFDMIFMDIQMPEMDGYEAAQAIRASPAPNAKTIPIIAMTANVFKEDVERCLEAGMNGHIGKPFDFDEVLEALRRYLGDRRREIQASPASHAGIKT
jgi:CheY-like chemotaxis protein